MNLLSDTEQHQAIQLNLDSSGHSVRLFRLTQGADASLAMLASFDYDRLRVHLVGAIDWFVYPPPPHTLCF